MSSGHVVVTHDQFTSLSELLIVTLFWITGGMESHRFRHRSITSGENSFLLLISTNVCARSVGWATEWCVCGRGRAVYFGSVPWTWGCC